MALRGSSPVPDMIGYRHSRNGTVGLGRRVWGLGGRASMNPRLAH